MIKNIKTKVSDKELFYDRFSHDWSKKINNLETNKRLKVVFGNLLKRKDIHNKKFLEVGCGLGYFSNKAFKLGAKVTGVDVGSSLIKISKKLTPKAKFKIASASGLPFLDNSFDLVLSTEVIEHVGSQEKALKEMARVVKKGGLLVLTTPNLKFKPLFDLLSILNIRPYHGYEKWIAQEDLAKRVSKYNMSLIKSYKFNFIFPNKFLDKLENAFPFNIFTINYGLVFKKL